MKNIAFIPARSGSKRVKNKNIKKLNDIPLINYTIQSAISSNLFDRIIVVTDSVEYEKISIQAGAESLGLRPKNISGSNYFQSNLDLIWQLSQQQNIIQVTRMLWEDHWQ